MTFTRREILQNLAAIGIGARAQSLVKPFRPKALYLSGYGLGTAALREPALRLMEETELNAVVIDVKGDRGWIAYPSAVPLATECGAQKVIPAPDADTVLCQWKARGIYLIARIVVFKDNPLAVAKPALAVKAANGAIWRDREQLAWTDPFQTAAWQYNIDLAVEAAGKGFDEIQFDYMRFPDAPGLIFSQPCGEQNRVRAIQGFLQAARKRLAPLQVALAGDIFGYVCWNSGDTGIGQQLEELAQGLDYVCPMLYPSGFTYGIPGYPLAVAHPYEIVLQSLRKAQQRTGADPLRFRPWLQAFGDYAFDRRAFGGPEIRRQIAAAEEFGTHGWMLWNPRNLYSPAGLR